MKVYPLLRKTILMLVVSILVGGGLIFAMTFHLFLFTKWTWAQPTILIIYGVASLLLLVLTPRMIYYEVNKKYVIVSKYGKKAIYYYTDVVYIDERLSEKRKTVHFYTNKGHARYIAFDQKGILYKTMLSHCKNRLSEEEFHQSYPNVKL
ncbi:MAG: hypothetical protein K6F07_04200 [Bacilli bacterium]|nr:hypothetical protein [Bacilli bacterium]